MRRSTVFATAVMISLVGLVGCDDDAAPAASASASSVVSPTVSPTATAEAATASATAPSAAPVTDPAPTPSGFDPAQALALAERAPYAATQDFKSEGGPVSTAVNGRVNLNGPVRTGRLAETVKSGLVTVRGGDGPTVVVTDDGTTYIRLDDSWSTSPLGDRIADYHGYAKVLLSLGPSARKGIEDCDGTPCFHLAGTVDLERIKPVEAELYKLLKGKNVTSFRLDQWIDAQGRTVRFDRLTEAEGLRVRTYGTFRDFGPVEKVDAPV
ncbi:hypothetical protein [Kitasatospora sp. NPDC057500]|uniref:hypothetical protein n=1 Tax=Kitasatospora sp. NPDC057500 TaxID=3346151 RepID=UPI00369035E6